MRWTCPHDGLTLYLVMHSRWGMGRVRTLVVASLAGARRIDAAARRYELPVTQWALEALVAAAQQDSVISNKPINVR